ncbi:MAG: hypothetical protein HP495_07915 [Nitrospira sp.]|nr:hypothetical protein [Nitrospira sp.]
MLKITSQRDSARQDLCLILEGRLAGQWVDELRVYCGRVAANQQRCSLIDLTGVTFVDAEGKALLAQLWQQGTELRASGCLTRCLVEDIAKADRTESAGQQGNRMSS